MSHLSDVEIGQSQHKCNCGANDSSDPVIDARLLPHEVRHAAIFGALDSIEIGKNLVVIAPHNPLPLIKQAQKRYDEISIDYLLEGPDAWHVRFGR